MFIVPLTSSITPMETMSQKKQTESTDDGEATFFDVFESLVKNVKELPRVIKEAFYIASTGRPGPVLVDIAKDVFDAELDFSYPDSVRLRGYKGSIKGDEKGHR